jgi:N-acetylglutamate synthase-like GNAT family acetyltransferase
MGEPILIRTCPPKSIAFTMLRTAKLPIEDLQDNSFEHFFFAGPDSSPKGLVGVELHGRHALLRSLVVVERERGQGIAVALVKRVEAHAASHGVQRIFLLTTTAESFFNRRGYTRIDRSLAPPSIQRTREYSDLCPKSSAFMVKGL